MKPTKLLLVLAAMLLVPSVASAQRYRRGGGYYGGGPAPASQLPGGFHNRQGRLIFGASIGLGGMSDRGGDINCSGCDYSTISGEADGHIGGFLGPRFALMAELQVNAQTLSSNRFTGETSTLVQSALMVAGQYWVTPQLWLKGGIGFANIQVDTSYYGDGITDATTAPENGGAIMGAIGYEVLSAPYFSIDLMGRVINASYKGIDNNVTGATIGIGINWF
jgi:hypothetical protein